MLKESGKTSRRRRQAWAGLLMLGFAALTAQPSLAQSADDTLTVAIGAEPETMLPRAACSISSSVAPPRP